MNKRRLKKAILAEALRLHREYDFPVRTCTIDLRTSTVVHRALARPHEMLTDLMHLCGLLQSGGG